MLGLFMVELVIEKCWEFNINLSISILSYLLGSPVKIEINSDGATNQRDNKPRIHKKIVETK